ncbi:MAG: YvcK family protein [bacterium]|nr:YvcK family protein [bacterium]
MTRPKIVCLGGGTGTYTVLRGLRHRDVELTAVVSMADSGGSSGRLRDEFGVLPPGDVRRCLLALAADDETNQTLRQLFEYRFDKGQGLNGHSFGNLFITALTEICGRTDQAIIEASRILRIKGQVLPVALADTHLWAQLDDGTLIKGENHIDVRTTKPEVKISRVFLEPEAEVYAPVAREIAQADLIVIGPGDLYTSVIPTLLPRGVAKAISRSAAKKVYVCNLMTKHGETDDFAASDFVREVLRYLEPDEEPVRRLLDAVIINKSTLPQQLLAKYTAEGAQVVQADEENCRGLVPQVIFANVSSATTLFRHDPGKLAEVLMNVI